MRQDDALARRVFLHCACGEHAIELSRYHGDDEIYLSFWYLGRWLKPLWARLTVAWKVLTGRDYCYEEIVLTRNDAEQLRDYLNDLLEPVPTDRGV